MLFPRTAYHSFMFRPFSVLILSFLFTLSSAYAQQDSSGFVDKMFDGLKYETPDSSFSIEFGMRMQSRLGFTTQHADDLKIDAFEARIRRLRTSFEGHVLNPRFTYKVQLGFSRSDLDMDDTGVANIIRDAVVAYHPNAHWEISFGLSKLPGNRQAFNSSSKWQFSDESIVSSAMKLDRDFGIKIYYTNTAGQVMYHLKGAVSTGEGRPVSRTDAGLAYTVRAELLPLGAFTNGGDYFEGDLAREQTPKLSLGGGYSFNSGAIRVEGQTGPFLYDAVDLTTTHADLLFKYNGWAYAAEFMRRSADQPFTYNTSGDMRYAFAGQGVNQQLSYVFPSFWELAGRYSWLRPHDRLADLEKQREVLELGITRYLAQHRIKLQLNGRYEVSDGEYALSSSDNSWGGLFQIELGI